MLLLGCCCFCLHSLRPNSTQKWQNFSPGIKRFYNSRFLMFVAKKIGYKAAPPQLVLDYTMVATGQSRRRIIPIHDLTQAAAFACSFFVFFRGLHSARLGLKML